MSFINKALCEINCKIVYYGAGLGGKTTNLQWIFEQTSRDSGERMLSLATENDRTLFFDFLPLDLGTVRGFKIRLHLYTVPGQISYQTSRKLILRGVDGVVFVADSHSSRMEANLAAIEDLQQNLKDLDEDFRKLPYVLQINKRDLTGALPVSQMTSLLARKDEPVFEAVASKGVGVLDTLKSIGRLVLARMKKANVGSPKPGLPI
ncbi:MAG: GTP-binding protein [Terriglobia bacterium]